MALRLLRFLSFVTLLGGAAAAGLYFWGYSLFHEPGALQRARIVVLPKGQNVREIADILSAEGVIGNSLVFEFGVRLRERSRDLKAGEFAFPAAVSMKQVVDILVAGKVVVHRLTIAEGLTAAEVLALLSVNKVLAGDLPTKVPEGSLLPETYHFVRGDKRRALLQRMRLKMSTTVAQLWQGRDKGIAITTPAEAVILASIVEKETGKVSERPHIAGVFMNRLKINMKLQSDPTVSYGITLGKAPLGRKLTKGDLQKKTPYNTYTIDGLPPAPIGNPGIAALSAVMQPMATKDLYFVADGSGGHAFARTYPEHQRNVRKWRKLSR